MNYISAIWGSRYFWWHLSMSDLRARWRRSYFGAFWSILQPLGMTLLLALVFSKIFGTPLGEYAPYIMSGIIVWEYIATTVVNGAVAFVSAEPYIKQTPHPLAIYTLRTALTGQIILAFASVALVLWVLLVFPENLSWSWFAALLVLPLTLAIAWPAATIVAYFATRFRDIPHALGLVLQAMWLVSPIFFQESTFRQGDLHILLDYNPIYHLLEVIRAPLLRGEWPTLANIVWCIGTATVLAALAVAVGRRAEQRVIFYL